MDTSENQKVIIVQKSSADKNHPYSIMSQAAVSKALLLKGSDLKLWLYLASNQNNYTFALSRVDVCRSTGMSKPTYLKSVQSLIDLGFLVESKENSNTYYFYEAGADIETEDDLGILIPEPKQEEIEGFKF